MIVFPKSLYHASRFIVDLYRKISATAVSYLTIGSFTFSLSRWSLLSLSCQVVSHTSVKGNASLLQTSGSESRSWGVVPFPLSIFRFPLSYICLSITHSLTHSLCSRDLCKQKPYITLQFLFLSDIGDYAASCSLSVNSSCYVIFSFLFLI